MGSVAGSRPVLAIGVDAAEPAFVRHLIREGELPVLASLLDEGRWVDVEPPPVGSGAVWPTFFTGTGPEAHGTYGNWAWRPDQMRVVPTDLAGLTPFWIGLERAGRAVGLLDVPFAPHTGVTRGFEVTEWGAHDVLLRARAASPAWVGGELHLRHPFQHDRTPAGVGPRSPERLRRACVKGARLRGDLASRLVARARPDAALIVFSEVHHAGHELWHTVVPAHPAFSDLSPPGGAASSALRDVYREVDTQIGRLLDAVPATMPVAVFSLHGMRPGRGVVTVLQPVLEALGWAVPTRERDPRRRALAGLKRLAPPQVKKLYYRLAPRSLAYRVAEQGVLPPLEWRRTRAFALPSDQNGWVRINLKGRERDGIVAREDYEGTCSDLAATLSALRSVTGEPLVREVVVAKEPHQLLPDLVVLWSGAACGARVRVADLGVEADAEAPRLTGQHAGAGFCITRGAGDDARETVQTTDLAAFLFGSA